jgi:arginyl-tRNA synthetase
MKESDPVKQASYVSVIQLVLKVLELAVSLLGFEAPERM